MSVTITSDDERARMRLDVNIPRGSTRLVLVDESGREYHFGSGRRGSFAHVATYTPEGREPYAWWSDVLEGLEGPWRVVDEPLLGPRVSPLTAVALAGLAQLCNQNNGFYAEPEKKWAVQTLRALWDEAREPLDAEELAVWVATHGWTLKHAKKFRDLVNDVRNGKSLRGSGGRAIARQPDRAKAMVAHWREQLS